MMIVSDASRQLYHNFKYINDMDLFGQSGTLLFICAEGYCCFLEKKLRVCNRKKCDC